MNAMRRNKKLRKRKIGEVQGYVLYEDPEMEEDIHVMDSVEVKNTLLVSREFANLLRRLSPSTFPEHYEEDENQSLSEAELKAAIDGLMAYDCGSRDSGINDEELREQVQDQLDEMEPEERKKLLLRIAIELCSADSQYGLDDMSEFISWLDDNSIDYSGLR